eukprot:4589751-Amphidinium_carterae.1
MAGIAIQNKAVEKRTNAKLVLAGRCDLDGLTWFGKAVSSLRKVLLPTSSSESSGFKMTPAAAASKGHWNGVEYNLLSSSIRPSNQ